MRCPVCNEAVPDGESFCPGCGHPMAAAQEAAPEPPAAPDEQATPSPAPHPLATAPAARLLVKRAGALTGDEFPIAGRVIVGRFDPDSGPVDVDLAPIPEAHYISRHHAEIYQDASGQWFVKDLGSTNGSFLLPSEGGQPQRIPAHQPAPVKDGDEIAFGNARFVFKTQ